MKPRSIVLLVLVLSAAATAHDATKPTKEQALAAIRRVRGRITVDTKSPGRPVTAVTLSRAHVTDADLFHLRGLPMLRSLSLVYTDVSGNGLVHLKGLAELRALHLHSSRITDAGLVHLQGLMKDSGCRLDRSLVEHISGW